MAQQQNSPSNIEDAVSHTFTDMKQDWTWLYEKISEIGWSLVSAILVLFIGFWLTTQLRKLIEKRMIARNVDPSVRSFLLPIIGILLKIMVIIPVIGRLGINVSGFIAALSAGAVAVGLALQGSLANFAGGILIIIFKPFRIGDTITSQGNTGTVQTISILYTTILTGDRKVIIMPNASVFNNPITNFSMMPERIFDIRLNLAYDNKIDEIENKIIEMLENEKNLLRDKPYSAEIVEFTPQNIVLSVKGYTLNKNITKTTTNINKELKKLLENNNIKINSNNEVHVYNETKNE